jgi:acetyl-CoA carboxylase biotin carboxyl carrier protein
MRLVEQSDFDELNLEMDGVKLSLRRGAAAAKSGTPSGGAAAPAAAAPPPAAAPLAAPGGPPPGGPPSGTTPIESPMLGTFYRAPKPGAAPFVEVGSEVEPETVIGIIEVMKLMNTVRAGVRGTVTEIPPADGTLVEYGEVLMRVRAPA